MSQLQPHQQRVLQERDDLEEKISKLVAFINTGSFMILEEIDQKLLKAQLQSMKGYMGTLQARIERFEHDPSTQMVVFRRKVEVEHGGWTLEDVAIPLSRYSFEMAPAIYPAPTKSDPLGIREDDLQCVACMPLSELHARFPLIKRI